MPKMILPKEPSYQPVAVERDKVVAFIQTLPSLSEPSGAKPKRHNTPVYDALVKDLALPKAR